MKMDTMGWIAWTLVILGAINWGLWGAFNYNLVEMLFGLMLAKWVYILVGVSGLYFLWQAFSKKQ